MPTQASQYVLKSRAKHPERYAAYQAAYEAVNRDKIRAREKAHKAKPEVRARENEMQRLRRKRTRATPEGWLKLALWAARNRCLVDGREFNITAADIAIPDACPIIGKPFAFGGGNYDRTAPSLDRINPKRGYTEGNVRVISQYANTIRQDCTDPKIFQALADDAARLSGVM